MLATIFQRQGNSSAALEAAQKNRAAPEDEPVADPFQAEVAAFALSPRALTDQIHPLLAARKLEEAAPLVERVIKEHPDFAESWLVLGRLRYLRNDFRGAQEALKKHLSLDPASSQGLFHLGMAQLGAGQFREAAATFGKATELEQDFGPAWFNRGYALGRAGAFAQAAESFREALRHNPEHFETYLLLADLDLRLTNRIEALKILEQAESLKPSDPRLSALRQRAAAP
jgi:tetratricopeptide (TPR) repeat protein